MRIGNPRLWLPAILCSLLAACGGVSDTVTGSSSGTGTGTTPSSTSTTQAVVASGAISGFGSVYVNGIHFETNAATITRDGDPALQSELKVGEIVDVVGHVDPATGRSVADEVRQRSTLEGPITSIDSATQSFVVLSHTVKVTTETSFEDTIGNFAGLTTGLQVEVAGMPDSTNSIVATRVERRRAGDTQLEVFGKISALDTVAKHFNIDQLVVDYTSATLRDFGTTQLANGLFVKVKGPALSSGGLLNAAVVILHDVEHAGPSGEANRTEHELEGLITRFVSATNFDIAGHAVTTADNVTYEGGTAADLALNAKVEADGPVNASGVLVATRIKFKRSNNAGIAGVIQAVSANSSGLGGTLTVMGVTITVDNNTRVEDKTDSHIEMFRLANVQVGDYVAVRGIETGALQLTASRLERRRLTNEVWVRGTVRNVASPNFTSLGVPVTTNNSTLFKDSTSANFFATAAGRVARVVGTLSSGQITAVGVEFAEVGD